MAMDDPCKLMVASAAAISFLDAAMADPCEPMVASAVAMAASDAAISF